jgi:hypothetical protein
MPEYDYGQSFSLIDDRRKIIFISRSDGMTTVEDAPTDEHEFIQDYLGAAKARLFEAAPSREEGINTERVDQFLHDQGLQTKPSLLLNPEDVPGLHDAMVDVGFDHPHIRCLRGTKTAGEVTLEGVYLELLGTVLMVRSPEMEAVYGSNFSEQLLAHEKAHSSEDDGPVVYRKTQEGRIIFAAVRGGQFVPKRSEPDVDSFRGTFLEEAFAERVAARYTAEELSLPASTHTLASVAAHGIDLIARVEPAIDDALIQARTSIEGKREVAQIINSVRPGLYMELCKLQYNDTDFSFGLQSIQAALAARKH